MNDSEMIALFLAREPEAVSQVQDQYGTELLHFAERMLGHEDGMECVNDTLLKAWNSIPPARPDNLKAYLYKICRNLAINQINWQNAVKRKATVVELTKELEECISGREENDAAMEHVGQALSTFVRQLPLTKRQMFLRRYWYGDSAERIGELFGCSQNKVNVTLHRLRKQLKEYLIKEGIEI